MTASTRFIAIGYERRELDATIDVPEDIAGELAVEDLAVDVIRFSDGFGF